MIVRLQTLAFIAITLLTLLKSVISKESLPKSFVDNSRGHTNNWAVLVDTR